MLVQDTRNILLTVAVGVLGGVAYMYFSESKSSKKEEEQQKHSRQSQSGDPSENTPHARTMDAVRKNAIVPTNPPTAQTGMQWDASWKFPRADKGAVTFTANVEKGLMVGLSRGMTDTAGGYVMHVLAPVAGSEALLYGVSDMYNINDVRAYKTAEPKSKYEQTFWISYDNGTFAMGYGVNGGYNEIFSTPYPFVTRNHNAPMTGIRFIGFGSSAKTETGPIDIKNIRIFA